MLVKMNELYEYFNGGGGGLSGVVANVPDCDIVGCKVELQSRYYEYNQFFASFSVKKNLK